MCQRAKRAYGGPSTRKLEPARRALFSEYNAFAHKRSILIGENCQVLLISPKPAAIIKHKHGMASQNPSVGFILEAYRKLSIVANNLVGLKQEQEMAVNCLSEGRDVSADMPTGFGELTFDI